MFSLFCECIHLEYVRIHVICRVNQAERVIHIRVVAPQEYVNIYLGFQASKCVRGELKRRKYQVKARYQIRANALLHDIAITNIVWCMAYNRWAR